jgi:transposase-like protein
MPLTSFQVAAINHIVASDLGGGVTDKAFCERMDIDPKTLWNWRNKDEEFIRALDATMKEARESTDVYALRTRQWALEELENLYHKSKSATEKRAVLKDILAQTKDVSNRQPTVEYEHLPNSELVALYRARNLTSEDLTEERLIALAKGD